MRKQLDQIVYEIWPSNSTNGQKVGCGPTGIRGVHPLGIQAICETERSQHKNKIIVTEMIEWALAKQGYK